MAEQDLGAAIQHLIDRWNQTAERFATEHVPRDEACPHAYGFLQCAADLAALLRVETRPPDDGRRRCNYCGTMYEAIAPPRSHGCVAQLLAGVAGDAGDTHHD